MGIALGRSYQSWAHTRDEARTECCSLGEIRRDFFGHFVLKLRLASSPTTMDLSEADALSLADAIIRLHRKTAPPVVKE